MRLTVDHADAGGVAGVTAALHLDLVVQLELGIADGGRGRTVGVRVVPADLPAAPTRRSEHTTHHGCHRHVRTTTRDSYFYSLLGDTLLQIILDCLGTQNDIRNITQLNGTTHLQTIVSPR